ncbi:Transcriptional regulator [gamma proteobacterium HdN1]|nr:Transcriptional regulator [gamma proteobacterium HdN1]
MTVARTVTKAKAPAEKPKVMDTRTRIMEAALVCVQRWGIEKVTLNEIAQEAGVTRPTVYSHFGSRDEIVQVALMQYGMVFSEKLLRHVSRFPTAQQRVVETMVFALKHLPKEPALALLQETSLGGFFNAYALSVPASNAIRRDLFRTILGDASPPEDELDELTEVATRFLLSLLTMQSSKKRSDRELRGFLERRLIPALGLHLANEPAP